jgi:hypothetical protein
MSLDTGSCLAKIESKGEINEVQWLDGKHVIICLSFLKSEF